MRLPTAPQSAAKRRIPRPCPFSCTSIHPASGMVISLGKGTRALSIVMSPTPPLEPMASWIRRTSSRM
jgi:hypothetical protein